MEVCSRGMTKNNEDAPTDLPPTVPDDRAVEYQWDDESTPSIAVVEAVAATTGKEPRALPPLQHAIDGDALDDLFTGGSDGVLRLSFEYAGTAVTLHQSGRIDVLPP